MLARAERSALRSSTGAEGAHKGRKPTARAKADEVAALKTEGRSVRAIAKALGIGVGSAHGMLKAPVSPPA